MKSQGLPMSTIAILILVVIVLIGVAMFFFLGFMEGGEGMTESQKLTSCQSKCSRAQHMAAGLVDISLTNNCNTVCGGVGYCKKNVDGTQDKGNFDCNEYMGACEVLDRNKDRFSITCDLINSNCTCTKVV